MTENLKIDWSFKIADVIKIVVLAILVVLAYAHMEDRLARVEEQTNRNSQVLAHHIEEQNETTAKLNLLLARIATLMEEYPLHRHEGGSIIYPRNGFEPTGK
jgi:Tfp pilus assembly protein PilO